jgi:hypothetical protein
MIFALCATAAFAGLANAAGAPPAPPHKAAPASSFAPKAHNKRHVYGAPIQPPIVRHVKKKPRQQAGAPKSSASAKASKTHVAANSRKDTASAKPKGRPASRCPPTAAETGCVIESPPKALPGPAHP